jgi:3-hydroxybutyryl-CoA dehydrogenase
MGQGIASCLLARGFHVVAYNRTASRAQASLKHIGHALDELARRKVVTRAAVADWRKRYTLTDSIDGLRDSFFVVETVKEDLALKREIYDQLEGVVKARTVISSNTSSIPITVLQKGGAPSVSSDALGEPAEIMQYLEIIPARRLPRTIELTKSIGEVCGKMPRCLTATSAASSPTASCTPCCARRSTWSKRYCRYRNRRSFLPQRHGWWSTIAGPFRWMDLTGIPAYMAVMEDLLRTRQSTKVPADAGDDEERRSRHCQPEGLLQVHQGRSREVGEGLVNFTYDIRGLAEKYQKQVKF